MSVETAARPESWVRRHSAGLLVAAVLLAVAAVGVVTMLPASSDDPLDPASTSLDGAAAVANVLEDHGIEVSIVRSAAELDARQIGISTTVVVTSTGSLGETTVNRLVEKVPRGRLVLVEPTPQVGEQLELQLVGYADGQRDNDCALTAYDGLELSSGGGSEYLGTDTCYAGPGDGAGGWLARTSRGITVLGAGDILSNGEILAADNAAVALRLLGSRPELVWYVPDPADLSAADGASLAEVIPRWLRPGLVLVALGLIATMLWRGRRLGPVLSEPLPVTVKAIETTLNRGSIYRRSGDRRHIARALRAATRRRLTGALHLPVGSPESELIAALQAYTGGSPDDLHRLLADTAPAPTNDSDLISLAQALAALEEGITR